MGTWTRNIHPDILENLNDKELWRQTELINKLTSRPTFNHICHVHFGYLADRWDYSLYQTEFKKAIRDCYGPKTIYTCTPIGNGRRYKIYDSFQRKIILWECDVYPK